MEISRQSIKSPETGIKLISLFHSYHEPVHRNYSSHRHTSFEIALFKKGKGTYSCNHTELDFQEGDLFVFSTNEEHFISNIDEPMLVMNLHFEPQYIYTPLQSGQDNSFLKIFFDRSEQFCNRLPRDHEATKEILRLFGELENEFTKKSENYELMIKVKLLSMLVLMSRELGYANTETHKKLSQAKCPRELVSVMNYVNCHFDSDINLNVLSRVGNMSPNYLCTVFKQITGMTIWEYVLIRRIDEAKRMLRESNDSILSIQLMCGFHTSSNFNKAFKKLVGMTPSEYKKQLT